MCAAIVAAGALVLAACDTGDGRDLKPYDPADYPSQTSPPSTDSLDSLAGLDAVGAGGAAFDDPVVPDSAWLDEDLQVFAPWAGGATIDVRNTCDGDDVAPAVSWGAVPTGAVEIAIVMVDDSTAEDGQDALVHWVIAGLDPTEIALVEGDVPDGAVQALNDFGAVGYTGPCPPAGEGAHHYRLTAHALNSRTELADGTSATELLDAITRASIGSADLIATYGR